jgi:hypothetical protein
MAQRVEPFWTEGPPPPPDPPRPELPIVAELGKPPVDALVTSLNPLIPVINRAKLKTNLQNISSPENGYKLTRLTGGPGVGKSYSYELIQKAAREAEVTSACVNLQGKSLAQACELIARSMKLDQDDMKSFVLRDKPDDGPLARKFVRWLSKATQSIPHGRWWLMLDSLDKESVLAEVREILVSELLEALALDELPQSILFS